MSRKVLFVHDGPMGVHDNNYYGVHYKNDLVERYHVFGDTVTFLMRVVPLTQNELSNYSLIDHSAFRFITIPNFKSIRSLHQKSQAETIIKTAVADHDMVIARLPSAAGVIALNEANRLGKPVMVEFVACVFDALWNYDWRGKLIAHYKYRKYQKLMRDVTHTVYVTNEFLQGRYPTNGKSVSISNVVLDDFNTSTLEERLTKIASTDQPLVLATIAALDVPYKGQDDVIKAIGILKKRDLFFKYKLVGQGDASYLKKLIKKYDVEDLVTIVGPLAHDEIFNFIDSIDVYIQPSKQEGLPRALIESMSRACPALGARTAGIPELIDEDCIFKPGSVAQIVTKLSAIDSQWLKANAKANFEMADHYRRDKLELRRSGFYNEFLKDYSLE